MKTVAIWSLRKYRDGMNGNVYEPMIDAEESAIRGRIAEVIGARLEAARISARKSQGQLGAIVGVHRNTVSRWEQGHCDIDAVTLYMICCALDVSPLAILRLVTVTDERDKLPMAAAGHK